MSRRKPYKVKGAGGSSTSAPVVEDGTRAIAVDLVIPNVRLSTSLESLSPKPIIAPLSSIAAFYAAGARLVVPTCDMLMVHSAAWREGAFESMIFLGPGTVKLVTEDLQLRELELPEGVFQLVRFGPRCDLDLRMGEVVHVRGGQEA